eukprot:COSAG02_NODE_24299_length_692_cov_1.453626_1_plen_39_part_10
MHPDAAGGRGRGRPGDFFRQAPGNSHELPDFCTDSEPPL